MKHSLVTVCSAIAAACLLPLTARAASPHGWTDNYSKAVEEAKAEKKYLLLDFTGSDWCGFCKLLEKEVFSTPQFSSWAKKYLVLVTVDFPHQTPLSAEVKSQNADLAKKYPAHGYPTIVVTDADGKVLATKVGYSPGTGAAKYIADLEAEIKKSGPMPTPSTTSGGNPQEPSIFKTARPSF